MYAFLRSSMPPGRLASPLSSRQIPKFHQMQSAARNTALVAFAHNSHATIHVLCTYFYASPVNGPYADIHPRLQNEGPRVGG